MVHCFAPASAVAGNLSVYVSNNGQDFEGDRRTVFLYGRTTQGIRAVPSTGPVLGGTSVTVVGSDFVLAPELRCWFGQIAVLAAVINETAVSCVCPAAGGAQSVQLMLRQLRLPPAADAAAVAFRYVQGALPHRMLPSSGPLAGGTLVQLIGTGFEVGLTSCAFGTEKVRSRVITSSLMQLRTPAASEAGKMTVRAVQTDHMPAASVEGIEFSFLQGVTIERLDPSTGPEAGATVVQVSGAGFGPTARIRCRFGMASEVASAVRTSTRLECTSPPHRPGNFSVAISPN